MLSIFHGYHLKNVSPSFKTVMYEVIGEKLYKQDQIIVHIQKNNQ